MATKKSLIGQRFGDLFVIEEAGSNKHRQSMWKCKCDCGNEIIVKGCHLKSGHTRSCGCLRKKTTKKLGQKSRYGKDNPSYKHGDSRTRLHNIWSGMRKRCLNKNSVRYKDYGGKGIIICNEWSDFINFKGWAFKNGYEDDLTIDRINSNKNYCPENCRWLTLSENSKQRWIAYKTTLRRIEECGRTIS